VFDILKHYIAEDALYDSRAREKEQASTCQPGTRERVTEAIQEWAVADKSSPICWLCGPAGAGKSTIAHTIAKQCDNEGTLAATFFFSRKKGDRSDMNNLFPTLASQLAQRIPSSKEPMLRALREDPFLLRKSLSDQFLKLIVEPFELGNEPQSLKTIIIDGLDECNRPDDVVKLVELLCGATNRFSFRLFLTSRPEGYIEQAFELHEMGNTIYRLLLQDFDARDDIWRYLEAEFLKIRKRLQKYLKDETTSWPSESVLAQLVDLSEGLFIYVSTLVQFVGDGRARPQDRLKAVLNVHAGVDPLYAQVINEARVYEDFDRVIGSLMYLERPLTINQLARLLRMEANHILLALQGCRSILSIPDDYDKSIRPYHASLRDFLTDCNRSDIHFLDPVKHHAQVTTNCLEVISESLPARMNDNGTLPDEPLKYACLSWYRHYSHVLSHEHPSPDLKFVCGDINIAMKTVDLQWLEYWLLEVVAFVNPGDVKLEHQCYQTVSYASPTIYCEINKYMI
jgi:RecA/RadA recombinase